MTSNTSSMLFSMGVPMVRELMGVAPERVYFVRQDGAKRPFTSAYGSLQTAITHADEHAVKRPVFVLLGDLREEVVIPNTLADGIIVGVGNRPRHGDSYPNAFGPDTASWRNSDGVTTVALLAVRAQGWTITNILFDVPTTAAAIELYRNASADQDEYDGSHTSIIGNRFAGGETGIESMGTENLFNVLVADNTFQDLTDGIKGLNAYRWEIVRNRFVKMTNCIDVAAVESEIRDNVMVYAPTKGFDLTGGSRNTVVGNVTLGDYNVINVAGTNDSWAGNVMQGETAALSTTTPSGS